MIVRRRARVIAMLFCVLFGLAGPAVASGEAPGIVPVASAVERWGTVEITLAGPARGNPYTEVEVGARFRQGERVREVTGFYDGDGVYKIRFMPEREGVWQYETRSNHAALRGKTGSVTVTPAGPGNHGPVGVDRQFHFAYADGEPFRQIGSTSLAWTQQGDALAQQTLDTLAASPFNKLRMAVLPVHDEDSRNAPALFPFAGRPPATWDLTRFDPVYFRRLEQRIGQLRALGIEADLILFHPRDQGHWGFDRMPTAADQRYLRYVVARLAAFRNVWWSMASEFDRMDAKTTADWDRHFQLLQAIDPYQHLRSISNGALLYNHNKPWITHVSVRSATATADPERAVLYRDLYRKPVVFDEAGEEGEPARRGGDLGAEEMVLRFWQGTIAGTYVGHGERRGDASGAPWSAAGGALRGQSPARLAFLRQIVEEGPAEGLEPIDKWQDYPFAGKRGQYYLGYFGRDARASWPFALFRAELADGTRFKVEVIDTWNMTITPVPGVFELKKQGSYMFADK
ncbi:MAG: DUF5060 domain-containing protein, partial [Massilia sp.]